MTGCTVRGAENVLIHDHIQRAAGRGRPESEQHAWEGLVKQRRRSGLTDMSTQAERHSAFVSQGKKQPINRKQRLGSIVEDAAKADLIGTCRRGNAKPRCAAASQRAALLSGGQVPQQVHGIVVTVSVFPSRQELR